MADPPSPAADGVPPAGFAAAAASADVGGADINNTNLNIVISISSRVSYRHLQLLTLT
jgi:hypothetical protein